MADDVSPEDPFPRKRISVKDAEMAYVDVGEGDPIVFLHGNPTSSYLWRNVIPHVQHLGRCIAPDLIGMGESDKLRRQAYTLRRRTPPTSASCSTTLDLGDRVTLVLHDWGSALGFDWAERHRDRIRGIAFTEAIVTPLTWDDWPADARKIFQLMRSEDGEAAVLDKNVFVERILPASVARGLTPEAHDRYRAPFRTRRGPPAHPRLAAADPDRERAARRARGGRPLPGLARDQRRPQAVPRRRPGLDPGRPAAGAGAQPGRRSPR